MQAFYWISLISPFLFTIISKLMQLDEKKQNCILLFLFSAFTTIMIGTRTIETGADTPVYYQFYDALRSSENNVYGFEPLFYYLGVICNKIGFGFVGFNIIIASLTMLFFSLAIINNSHNVPFSVFLYVVFPFYIQMLNQVRQALAMMIALYAVTFLKRDALKKYIFWCVIAGLVHASTFVMILLIFVRNLKINRKTVVMYLCAGVGFMLFSNLVLSFMSKYLKYGGYLSQDYRYGAFDKNALLNLIVRVLLLLFVLYFIKYINKADKIYYHMAFICTVFQLMTFYNNGMGRITTIFFSCYLILIPNISFDTHSLKNNWQIAYPSFFIIFTIYYAVYNISKGYTLYDSVLF